MYICTSTPETLFADFGFFLQALELAHEYDRSLDFLECLAGTPLHRLCCDEEAAYQALQANGNILQYLSKEFQGNPLMVLEAVRRDGLECLQWASSALRCDTRFGTFAGSVAGRNSKRAVDQCVLEQ